MNSGTYYLVSADGNFRCDLTVSRINATEEVRRRLIENARSRVDNLYNLTRETHGAVGFVDLTTGPPNRCCLTANIQRLNLRTHYALVDGVQIPHWGNATYPKMEMVWVPPPDLWLFFAVDLTYREESGSGSFMATKQWLAATDDEGFIYRPPLPNLYADCHLCHGLSDRENRFDTALEALQGAVAQLQGSEWNADLPPDLLKSQQLFRWIPTKTGFDQQPPQLDPGQSWRDTCEKVGVEHLMEVT